MKKPKILNGLTMLLAMVIMFSCKSPQALMEVGEYDEAVIKAVEKLRKQRKKKEKHIVVVEEAFIKITNKDLRKIKALKAEGLASNWVLINDIHKKIQRRQDLIDPYLPLVAKNGYKADFRFVKIAGLEMQSRKRAAAYVYGRANELLKQGEGGNKLAARNAHDLFLKVDGYFQDYKEADKLRRRAIDLGTTHVLFVVKNSSFGFYPSGFERELMRFNEHRLEDFWTAYYTKRSEANTIDLKIVVDITDIDVSPELVNESSFTLSKDIEEKIKLANYSNTHKKDEHTRDSLKIALKDQPTHKIVTKQVFADVLEVRQAKSAFVSAELMMYDDKSQRRIFTERVNAESAFENIAATYRGDKRALSSEVKCLLNNSPRPFPSDESLVLEAAAHLKGAIENCIRKKDNLVLR